MARTNTARKATSFTHEGAPAKRIDAEKQLRRSVMACMLWEREFYEDGEDIAKRIFDLCGEVSPESLRNIAVEAREKMNLRHAPLLIAASMAYHHRGNSLVRQTVSQVIQRADELSEILGVVCKVNGVGPDQIKQVLSSQVKRGIADAFKKFDEYKLAKYNRNAAITLRDSLFLSHAKPKNPEQEQVFKRLVDGTLKTPDTWEVGLSSGANKKETFERLLKEGNLGYMALLRNLRNMIQAGVDDDLIRGALRERKGANRVLPFRFVAAARHAPQFEPDLDAALVANINEMPKLPGKTVVLIDVSGSMGYSKVSAKSDMTRMDAAATLGAVVPAEQLRVFTFSQYLAEVPPRKGMAGVDAIIKSQPHSATYMGDAIKTINNGVDYDRLIVITDEQSYDRVPDPKSQGYMINVASNKNGIGYGKWIHIDGFSEAVINYIRESEIG